MHDDLAAVAVDQDQVVVLDRRQRVVGGDDHRQMQRAREDRAVRHLAARAQDHAEYAVFGQWNQFGWRDRVADQNLADARRQLALLAARFARKPGLHACDHVIDVFATAAQVWIVHRVEYRDQPVALHLQCGTGAIAADPDQVVHAAGQLAIGEHQAVGVDEFGDFPRERAVQFLA